MRQRFPKSLNPDEATGTVNVIVVGRKKGTVFHKRANAGAKK